MYYDFCISCREPLSKVSGGIGTYTRELLKQLSSEGLKCAVFVPYLNSQEARITFSQYNVDIISVKKCNNYPNNINSDILRWSYDIYNEVKSFLYSNEIKLFEFPDYEAEGYYTICAAAYGLFNFCTMVRLHSPIFMLKTDNNQDYFYLVDDQIKSAEMISLHLCDKILYGADQMKERVFSYFHEKDIHILENKSFKIPHPSPEKIINIHDAKNKIRYNFIKRNGYVYIYIVGRLEYRKGQDILIKGFSQSNIKDKAILVFCGGDTNTSPTNGSFKEYLKELAVFYNVSKNVIFAGKLEQSELSYLLDKADAFVYPSRFENYPNALLEVLHLNKPLIVSKEGGMCEILDIYHYKKFISSEPTFQNIANSLNELFNIIKEDNAEKYNFDLYSKNINQEISKRYKSLLNEKNILKSSNCKISIIVPHKNQANLCSDLFKSIKDLRKYIQDIEVIFVDDGSDSYNLQKLKKLCTENNAKIIENDNSIISGPANARKIGIIESSGDILYFCDSDDYFNVEFVIRSINLLNKYENIDFCISPHEAFGSESYVWMPSPANVSTVLFCNFTNSSILIRRDKVSGNEFDISTTHSEDWFTAGMFLINQLNYAPFTEVGYFYRRGHVSRSTLNIHLAHQSENLIKKRLSKEFLKNNYCNKNMISLIERSIFESHQKNNVPTEVENVYKITKKISEKFHMKKFILFIYRLFIDKLGHGKI